MEERTKAYRLKHHIVGGGLDFRQGEIVEERQLGRFGDWLRRSGSIEEAHPANERRNGAHENIRDR